MYIEIVMISVTELMVGYIRFLDNSSPDNPGVPVNSIKKPSL